MHSSRRKFIAASAAGLTSSMLWTPGVMAEQLTVTSKLAEGPFYPDKLPLDTDNDLLLINDSINPGIGEVTHLSGRVLTANGSPVRNAVVEIWQVDGNGVYLHTGSSDAEKRDANFQGFGRFLTDSKGQYYFRTVKPVPYPGRTPHIHFAINQGDKRVLTTQMLIKGNPQNEQDGLFKQLKDPKKRETLLAEFKPLEGSTVGELQVNFDVVLGVTPKG
ncbi:MAG: protocatechuate 3,4-dioxygenase [Pirellulaceae bacterium]